jgi:hypothetical protein
VRRVGSIALSRDPLAPGGDHRLRRHHERWPRWRASCRHPRRAPVHRRGFGLLYCRHAVALVLRCCRTRRSMAWLTRRASRQRTLGDRRPRPLGSPLRSRTVGWAAGRIPPVATTSLGLQIVRTLVVSGLGGRRRSPRAPAGAPRCWSPSHWKHPPPRRRAGRHQTTLHSQGPWSGYAGRGTGPGPREREEGEGPAAHRHPAG